ncbi:copper transporter 5.1-like isoform X2 [Anopheles albimanus]|uniref:Copper transport protein n=1 Tax=Anopheles albimanus TaxID=7167 RepID=A0A182FKD3_ANOAL|nr:copper transporter 5.1-like isoform X2 [Anopheles albimanus]
MMHMAFWWGSNVGDVFFSGLTVNGTGAMVALCLTLTLLSVAYEAFKIHGAKVRARTARERVRAASCPPSESATLLSLEGAGSSHAGPSRMAGGGPLSKKIVLLLSEAIVFLCHSVLGYALMLTVMLYNGYLFVAVVGGMGLGYFLFGHLSMKVNMENFQAHQNKVICTARCLQQESVNPSASTSLDHRSVLPDDSSARGTAPATASGSGAPAMAVCH